MALQKLCHACARRSSSLDTRSSKASATFATNVSARSISPGLGSLARTRSYVSRTRPASSMSVRSSNRSAMRLVWRSTSEPFIMNSACGATTDDARSPFGVEGSANSNAVKTS